MMAMTKKERADMDALRTELLRAKAWRRTDFVAPDLPPPINGESSGWWFNGYSLKVMPAWSSSVSHGIGHASRKESSGSASQNSRRLYSTKILALKAMRYELECKCERELAVVDEMIAEELAKKSGGES